MAVLCYIRIRIVHKFNFCIYIDLSILDMIGKFMDSVFTFTSYLPKTPSPKYDQNGIRLVSGIIVCVAYLSTLTHSLTAHKGQP